MDIVCIGQLVADVVVSPVGRGIFDVDTTPVEAVRILNGGDAFNTAIDCAKLGVRVAIIGRVGADAFGDALLSSARAVSLDTSGVVRDPTAPTSCCIVLVAADGERNFLYSGGANERLVAEDVDMDRISGAKVVCIGGTYLLPGLEGEPAARLLRAVRERGAVTSFDVTWDVSGRWYEIIRPMLPHADIFMPSVNEAKHIAGTDEPEEIARFILDRGARIAVVKLGSQGCYIRTRDHSWRVPGLEARVADTTGAGDAFAAGFLTGVAQGWDLERCGLFGNAVGALCVEGVGATTGVRSMAETVSFAQAQGRW